MATIKRFEDLDVWKQSREICSIIGRLIENGQFKRQFELIDQIRRSSGSVMDNIAEGFERGGRLEFITFLGYAKGSCGELRSQLYRVLDYRLISTAQFDELFQISERVSGMIQKLIEYLQNTSIKGIRKKGR